MSASPLPEPRADKATEPMLPRDSAVPPVSAPPKDASPTNNMTPEKEPTSSDRPNGSEVHVSNTVTKNNDSSADVPLHQEPPSESLRQEQPSGNEGGASKDVLEGPQPPNAGAYVGTESNAPPALGIERTQSESTERPNDETPKPPLILSRRFLKTKKTNGTGPMSTEDLDTATRNLNARKIQEAAAASSEQAAQISPTDECFDPSLDFSEERLAEEDEEASKAFKKLKSNFKRKHKKGTATEVEKIEFAAAENAEKERQNRVNGKRSYEQAAAEAAAAEEATSKQHEENPMFLPSSQESEELVHKSPQEQTRPAKRSKSGKIPKKDLQAGGSLGLNSHLEKAKKEPKKSRKSSHQKTADGRVSKNDSKKKRGPKNKGNQGPAMLDLQNLLGNDIVEVSRENQRLGSQPTFGSTKNRQHALNELIASLPESQKKLHSSDRSALLQATRSFNSVRAIQPDHGLWKMRNGMATSLQPHQLLGTAWMCDRENSAQRPNGGLLCDDMGLGKTVQMIACMVDRRPSPDAKHKTTLIIVPASLTKQWLNEIGRHTDKAFRRVLLYRSGNRPMTLDDVAVLEDCDVVITTYHEVARSYPRCDPPASLTTDEAKDKWWRAYYEEKRGVLHRMFFYRIVLDEAHAIKTHSGRTSIACRALAGDFRWCLTGTPIQNALEEFYPYFSFLKVKNTGEQETFVRNYCRKGSRLSMNRLRTILSGIMLRRTHKDRLMNKPILSLPDLQEKTIYVSFNKVERNIYSIVKSRFIAKINAWGGAIARNHKNIFVLFLRLRQLVSHPLLIQTTLFQLLESEDLEHLWRLCTTERDTKQASNCRAMTEALRDQLNKVREKKRPEGTNFAVDQQHDGSRQVSNSDMGSSNDQQNSGEGFDAEDMAMPIRRLLEKFRRDGKWEEINQRSTCNKCYQPADDPLLLLPCEHLYCAGCLEDLLYEAAKQEYTQARCLECDQLYERAEPLIGFEESGRKLTESSSAEATPALTAKAVEKEDTSWIQRGDDVLYSAKMLAARVQISKWLQGDTEAKIIVFVQFRPLVDILAKICQKMGWGHLRLTGDMSFEARDKSLDEFTTNPDKRILLASLKVGGQGLNLTMASRVLLVDLWWNSCVEKQAFCRIWRIGATRPCEVVRLVVKESIDSQILQLQAYKDKIISEALEKRDGDKKLTTEDLMKLFGSMAPQRAKGGDGSDSDEDSDSGEGGDNDPEDEYVFVQDEAQEGDSDTELARVPNRERRDRI